MMKNEIKAKISGNYIIVLGQKRLFNYWIMQEMAPNSLGRTTLLHKSILSITSIFSMISFLKKSY